MLEQLGGNRRLTLPHIEHRARPGPLQQLEQGAIVHDLATTGVNQQSLGPQPVERFTVKQVSAGPGLAIGELAVQAHRG
jgi:hypothetical protein